MSLRLRDKFLQIFLVSYWKGCTTDAKKRVFCCGWVRWEKIYPLKKGEINGIVKSRVSMIPHKAPLPKGGLANAKRLTGGYKIGVIKIEHKHNVSLTERAKTLRKNMTKEEKHLWYDFLRSYPVRFLRQKVIDNYIVDFYCHEARLIIELDGSQHYEDKGLLNDKIRTERIEGRNLTVIRIPNNEVNSNFSGVCEYIDSCVKESLHR